MPEFANGKVYRVECDDGYFYIGSTCSSLIQRLNEHKRHCKLYPSLKRYSRGMETATIHLLKSVSCASRFELLHEEEQILRPLLSDPKCLNEVGAVGTKLKYNPAYPSAA